MTHWKLGRLPTKHDKRNIQFADILLKPLKIPLDYDFDEKNPVPTPMFANDRFGDCVLAGRSHQTLRFELLEQKQLISISDKDVINEYFKETGGADDGLVVLNSLNLWRKIGWKINRKTYKIKAYSQITPKDQELVRQAIYLNIGVGLGISFPASAMTQFIKGQVWDVVNRTTIEGGHYVLCTGYNQVGPVCVTWGRKQQMTWAFWNKYAQECYTIIDARNTVGLNMNKLEELLEKVTK